MDQISIKYSEIVESTIKKDNYWQAWAFYGYEKEMYFSNHYSTLKKLSKEYFDIFNNEILELFE